MTIMRQAYNPQFQFGQVPIDNICIGIKSRDDIPQLLLGVQHIYIHKNTFNQVVDISEKSISPEQEHQNSVNFIELRHKHSAVEPGINALEVHGLDRCPDRGLRNFNRYVALAVLGRNFQKHGAIVLQNMRNDDNKLKKAD